MLNYFLLAWDVDNAARAETARQLIETVKNNSNDFEIVFEADGLVVYAQADSPHNLFRLENNAGIVLGRLFRNVQSISDDAAVNGALTRDTDKIIKSRGDHLTDHYWGSYLAIMPTRDKSLLIGRDCSCLQLCYTTWLDGVFCAFSNLDALPFYGSVDKDINWAYLTKLARYTQTSLVETGLKHLKQLAGGQYAKINLKTKEVETFRSWKPEKFTEDPIDDFDTAKQALYNTVLATTMAQVRDYDSIAVLLSGGLDSSILLACLRKVHPGADIYAKHLLSTENDVSEEHYARSMADTCGVEMVVEQQAVGENNSYIGHITPPWPIPVDRDYMEDNEENAADLKKADEYIEQRSIKAFFKGQGGDIIFFKRPELAPLFDYQKKHALDPKYYEILMNTARLTQMSVWKLRRIVRNNESNAVQRPGTNNIFLSKEFLPDLPPSSPYDAHPWFQASNGYSFGKHNQLQQFTIFNHYAQRWTPSKPDILAISPFICQPVMELMLRIPTHLILAGGRNRGLAREAFKSELAPEVYAREQKGYVTKFFFNGLIEDLAAIRAYLHDGILMKEGFLDKAVLDAELNEDSIKMKLIGAHIINSVKFEKWARSLA